jgi:hypothetical protein
MFVFDTFEPGRLIGERGLLLERALVEQWLTLFPQDRDGDRMPPGMMAVVSSCAYSDILLPRPPGNVHGAHRFRVHRLPAIGDAIVTSVTCAGKELKGERRWVRFAIESRHEDSRPLFSGLMTVLWAK